MGWYQNLKLKNKLWIFSFFFLFTLVAATGVSLYLNAKISADAVELAKIQLPAVRKVSLADMYHDGMRAFVFRSIFAKEQMKGEGLKDLQDDAGVMAEEMRKIFIELSVLNLEPKVKESIQKTYQDVIAYTEISMELVNSIDHSSSSAFKAKLAKFESQFSLLEQEMGAIGEEIVKTSEVVSEKSVKDSEFVSYALLGSCIFVILVSLLFSFWFIENVNSRFAPLVRLIESVKSGVYSVKFTENFKDEFSYLGNAIVDLAGTIGDQITGVKKALDEAESAKSKAEEAMNQASIEKENVQKALKEAEIAQNRALQAQELASSQEQKARELLEKQESFSKDLQQKVNAILRVVDHANNGNFSARIVVVGNDSIDQLSHHLNGFFKKMESSLSEIDLVTGELNQFSQKIVNMNHHIEQSAGQTKLVSEKAMIISNQGKEEALELTHQVETIRSSSSEISMAAEHSSKSTSVVLEKAIGAGQIIQQLSQASHEIEQFTKVIATISSQTNLLALNATIEAARAGDAGRGFAVVASEVKELARQTHQAAEQVENQVKNISEVVSKVNISMGEIRGLSETLKKQSDSVYSSVKSQGDSTEKVFGLISKSNHNLENINLNMLTVKDVAENTSASITQMKHESAGLMSLSRKLERVVGQFKNEPTHLKKVG